ncbi:heparan N-sulfatase [Parapedobacter pyrenivorans]|uniref:Heparan N-sulfatase n=2 Tax=Parapedobacter pyrenivorans TaxID=1305674 RepID=A0A917M8J3_9SPHI|nr:heparan N-sulfatase [Parapedobacter pyrenivorans]
MVIKVKDKTNNKAMMYKVTVLLFSLFVSRVAGAYQDGQEQPRDGRPNIILIMADDLDSRQLSCYGGENLKTTHIDQLAADGMQFNAMIASEAMCVPTRASLFTGLYPVRHGAYQNHKPVYDGLKSVVHYLNDLGYRVGLTGKDHMTRPKSIFPFDIVPGFEPNCVSPTDNYFLDSVRNYIVQDEPYCLFVMSNNPHRPWTVGDPDEFDASELKLPPHWVDTELTRENFRLYLAEVRRLDNQVGDIMNLLKETGQDKNTIVVFLGEQGPQFPGGKWTLYDNGQKSSMIVKWPGTVEPDTQTDAIVQYEDVTPTLIDILGGDPISGLDGSSFKSVLKNHAAGHREVAFGIHNNIPEGSAYPMRSIRGNRYKLIWNLTPDSAYYIKYSMNNEKPDLDWPTWLQVATHNDEARKLTERIVRKPEVEFYDLENDPYELENLAGKSTYQEMIADYSAQLKAWMADQGDKGAALDVPIKRKQKGQR